MSRALSSLCFGAALAALGALVLGAPACTAELPAVDPSRLACFDDEPLKSGTLPCAESDWCAPLAGYGSLDAGGGQCTPRLGCKQANATRPGCDPEDACARTGACQRCDAVFGARTAAVRCEGGIHTSTSAPPVDVEACDCPDGTYCAVLADAPAVPPGDAYPLYVLPPGTKLPASQLGLAESHPDRRRCVRACSTEYDCPGEHTCRAAAVVTAGLLAGDDARSTIGVCYPDRLARTSTQADPAACRVHADCAAPGSFEPCRVAVVTVPDHPRFPAGAAWGEPVALVKRCVNEQSAGRPLGMGCTSASECKSGLCWNAQCALPCDPNGARCPSNEACLDYLVSRDRPAGQGPVEDRLFVCNKAK